MTSSSGPQADRSGRSQGFTLRERAACPQLCVFHLCYEGDGPRHASYGTISPSNLGRPHPACSESLEEPIVRTSARVTNPHCTTSRSQPSSCSWAWSCTVFTVDLPDPAPDNAN